MIDQLVVTPLQNVGFPKKNGVNDVMYNGCSISILCFECNSNKEDLICFLLFDEMPSWEQIQEELLKKIGDLAEGYNNIDKG